MSAIPMRLTERNITTEKNRMKLDFRQNLTISSDSEMALLQCYIPYSWFNITNAYNNTTLSYYWPTDATTNSVTFDESFMLISDISAYIQQVMLANGHYLVDENGLNVYYFEMQTNYTIYGCTVTFKPLPSTLPVGWSNPAGVALSVPTAVTPQLVFGSNNTCKLLGFAPSTSYPTTPKNVLTMINSPLIPQISPTSAILISCNMVNSPTYNTFGSVIHTFTTKVTFGEQIIIEPPQLVWYQCQGGTYPSFEITFYDQDYRPLGINDTQIVLTVLIRSKPKLLN